MTFVITPDYEFFELQFQLRSSALLLCKKSLPFLLAHKCLVINLDFC